MPGVVHPAVSTEHVVTRGEHKDHWTRVSAGQARHVSNVAPYQVQGQRVVSVTATGNRTMRHVATPEVEHSPDPPLTRLTVRLDPLRLEDILPGARILLEDTGAGLAIPAPQPQLGWSEAVCLEPVMCTADCTDVHSPGHTSSRTWQGWPPPTSVSPPRSAGTGYVYCELYRSTLTWRSTRVWARGAAGG